MAPTPSGNLPYRVEMLEKDMQDMKTQLRQGTSDQVYALRFTVLEDKFDVLNQDVRDIVSQAAKERKDYGEELKSIRESLSRIQISALVAGILFFLGIVSSVIVVLLTHNITR